jgi:hypothetical protein
MTRRLLLPFLSLLLAASFVALPARAAKPKVPRGKTWHIDFRADTLGIPPTGAVVMGGSWAVVEDSSAVAADSVGGGAGDSARARPRVLRQRSDEEAEASNWIRFPKPTLGRCDISVRFRVVSGELDPGVGLVFHLEPKHKNGYLARISGASGEMIAHYMLGGKRRDIKFQKMTTPAAGEWHTLGVRREGITIWIYYDGKEAMSLRDERFTSGTVGLWTEGDTVADFADLTMTAR